MKQTPILFLSDSPERPTGLARIGRDLASHLALEPRFRVGYLGLGGFGQRGLPFAQYGFPIAESEWGQGYLEHVWKDFAGSSRGIVFTINDPSRMLWLAHPRFCGDVHLERFLSEQRFEKWIYAPLDGSGPGGQLSGLQTDSLRGFDRVLCYTNWAKELVDRSIGARSTTDWMPHGLDFDMWRPQDKQASRAKFFPGLCDGDLLVGVNATNQARKDWGLVAMVGQLLRREFGKRVKFWWHIDCLERFWSVPALLRDFALEGCCYVSHIAEDEELAARYSSCDLTLAPGLGEGFGFPIFESLACGVPVLHGDYGGGSDLLKQAELSELLLPVKQWRLESIHNTVRPVFDPIDWAERAKQLLVSPLQDKEGFVNLRQSIQHLDYERLWSVWLRWFCDGLGPR